MTPLEREMKQGRRGILWQAATDGSTPHPDCLGVAWSSPAYWNWPEPTAALAVLAGQNKGRHTLDHCPKVLYIANTILMKC